MRTALRTILLGRRAAGGAAPAGTAVDLVVVPNGTTNALITTAALTSGTFGADAGSWTWSLQNHSPTEHTFLRAFSSEWARRTALLCNGVSYTGTGFKVLDFDLTTALANASATLFEGHQIVPPAGFHSVTVTMLVKWAILNGSADNAFDTLAVYSGGYGVTQYYNPATSGNGVFRAEGNSGGTNRGQNITVPDLSKVYSITIRLNSATNRVEICLIHNETGALLGVSEANTAVTDFSTIIRQSYLLDVTGGGGHLYCGIMAVDVTNAAFPLEPVTIPAPSAVSASQTHASELTVLWSGVTQRYKIERSSNAGASWTVLDANYDTSGSLQYVDGSVADATTYSYRITGLMGSAESAASSASSGAAVDNSAFPTALDSFDAFGAFDPLTPSTNWANQGASFTVKKSAGDGFLYNQADLGAAYYVGTWSANQKAEIAVQQTSAGSVTTKMGAAVRIQPGASTWYDLVFKTFGGGLVELRRVNGGSITVVQSTAIEMAVGEKLRITANGTGSATRLTAERYTSGAWTTLWTSQDPGGTYIDGGNPGVVASTQFGGDADGGIMIDDWKGYELP